MIATRIVVQLSDTHIRRPAELAERRVDTAASLRRAVEAVQRLPLAPDVVLVTGDCVDSGAPEEYAHLRQLLAPLAAPVHLLPGNHDARDAMREAFPEHAYLGPRGTPVDYALELPGLRLVAIDTSVDGATHGELDAGRLARLDALLAADRATPTILALHHPPFTTFIERMDDYGLRVGRAELADILARHPQVDRVVSGHLHRSIVSTCAGRPALTAPSTAHALAFDLGADAPLAFAHEPAGFLVHAWSASGGIASHVVYADAYEGPFRFGA